MPDFLYSSLITQNNFDLPLYISGLLLTFNLITSIFIYYYISFFTAYTVFTNFVWKFFSNFQYFFLKTFNFYFLFIFLRNPFIMLINTKSIYSQWNKIIDFLISLIFLFVYFPFIYLYNKYITNPFFFNLFKHSHYQITIDNLDIINKIFIIFYNVSNQINVADNHLTELVYFVLLFKHIVIIYFLFLLIRT